MKYEFKTEPYDHQRLAFEASCKRRYYGLFMEMGTGKSKVTIDTIGYLFLKKEEINTVLIVAPKGVFDNWVKQEIPRHLPDYIKRRVVRWQPNFTNKFKDELRKIAVPPEQDKDTLNVLVMNTKRSARRKARTSLLSFCVTTLATSR